jgi:hypothetical protein
MATIHRPSGCGPSGNESQPLDESFEEEELCEDAPPRRLTSILFSHYARSLSLSRSCSSSSFVADFLYYVAAICKKITRCGLDPLKQLIQRYSRYVTYLVMCYVPCYVLLISSICYLISFAFRPFNLSDALMMMMMNRLTLSTNKSSQACLLWFHDSLERDHRPVIMLIFFPFFVLLKKKIEINSFSML